jgi:general secretion pathway protein G
MARNTKTGKPRGFTLIELLVVASILIVLAAMALVQYRNGVIRAREGVLMTDLFHMRDAIDQYYADKTQYPGTLDALVSDGYLRKIPDDPFTRSSATWQAIPSEPDPNNPNAAPGVYDVKSGSDATALDGTKYADW